MLRGCNVLHGLWLVFSVWHLAALSLCFAENLTVWTNRQHMQINANSRARQGQAVKKFGYKLRITAIFSIQIKKCDIFACKLSSAGWCFSFSSICLLTNEEKNTLYSRKLMPNVQCTLNSRCKLCLMCHSYCNFTTIIWLSLILFSVGNRPGLKGICAGTWTYFSSENNYYDFEFLLRFTFFTCQVGLLFCGSDKDVRSFWEQTTIVPHFQIQKFFKYRENKCAT